MRITLSTGTIIDPNNGTLGINAGLEITEGYDNGVRPPVRDKWMEDDDGPFLTPAEQIELADIAIGWWTKLKERASAEIDK